MGTKVLIRRKEMGKKKQRITVIFLDDHMKMAAEALNPRDRAGCLR